MFDGHYSLRDMAFFCTGKNLVRFNPREQEFLKNIWVLLGRDRPISRKQTQWLIDLYMRIQPESAKRRYGPMSVADIVAEALRGKRS